jgi:hypothetical protein
MVAIFIFAMVFAAIYSSWFAIMRGAKSGLEAAGAVQRSRMAVATVDEALNCARSFASSIEYYSFVAENGDDATLSFVAKLPQSFPRNTRFGSFDVRRVTFSVEPAPPPDSGRQLVLRQNPVLMDMDDVEKEHPIVLAKDVQSFELAFWDVRSGDWIDEWTQTNQLPPIVMFTLRWGDSHSLSRQSQQEITRVVTLPATSVPVSWQVPGAPPNPPGPSFVRPGG